MQIIKDECLDCECFYTCGIAIEKGSAMCTIKRMGATQIKGEMYRKIQQLYNMQNAKRGDNTEY